MLNHKRAAAVVAALALAGAGPAPFALAQTHDLRSPDAIDASQGRYLGAARTHLDLSSPDAIDASQGRYLGAARTRQDLRSPDARDAATHYAPTVMESPIAQTTGFDWASAAIGAAAGTGLMVVALALAFGGRRRTFVRQG